MLDQLRRASPPVSALVRVRGRYKPEIVRVAADEHGAPVRVAFLREERATCSERVVFPELGLNVALPAYERVVVDLGWLVPGEYRFTCQMGVLRGVLVVEAEGSRR